MKRDIFLIAAVLLVSACAPAPPTPLTTPAPSVTPTIARSTTTPARTQVVVPVSPTARVSTAAQSTLGEFMRARLDRDEPRVLGLLTDTLEMELNHSTAPIQPPLLQLSNPCWYRFEALAFEQTEPTVAHARIRMFEHFWSGDSGGGLPRSWEQDVTLLETTAGWRVEALGNLEKEREEPDEPHAETISACIVVRTTTP